MEDDMFYDSDSVELPHPEQDDPEFHAMDAWLLGSNQLNPTTPYEPQLVKHLRAGQWTDALDRLEAFPHEALWSSREFGTILHIAFDHTSVDDDGNIRFIPMDVLNGIVQKCQKEILVLEHHGRNILQTLLDDWELYHHDKIDIPQTVELIGRLVQMNPKIVNKGVCRALLGNVWQLAQQFVPSFMHQVTDVIDKKTPITDITSGHLSYILKITDSILYAWQYGNVRPSDDPPYKHFVHCVMSLMDTICPTIRPAFPMYIFKFAIQSCTESIDMEWDDMGRTPLSILLQTSGFPFMEKYKTWTIEKLLENTPGASCKATNQDRKVPIHLAIESYDDNSDKYMHSLLADAPQSLTTREQSTRLYPFMYAGAHSKLNLCFSLLQQNPLLASGLAGEPMWKKMNMLKEENQELKDRVKAQEREIERMRELLGLQTAQREGKGEVAKDSGISRDRVQKRQRLE